MKIWFRMGYVELSRVNEVDRIITNYIFYFTSTAIKETQFIKKIRRLNPHISICR